MPKTILSLDISIFLESKLKDYHFDKFPITIGREHDCDLTIQRNEVSRVHLKIFEKNNEIYILDKGSANGTFLDAERVEGNTEIQYKGQEITLGNKEIRLTIRLNRKELEVDPPLLETPVFRVEDEFFEEGDIDEVEVLPSGTYFDDPVVEELSSVLRSDFDTEEENLPLMNIPSVNEKANENLELELVGKREKLKNVEREITLRKEELLEIELDVSKIKNEITVDKFKLSEIQIEKSKIDILRNDCDIEVEKIMKKVEKLRREELDKLEKELESRRLDSLASLEDERGGILEKSKKDAKGLYSKLIEEGEEFKSDGIRSKKKAEREAKDLIEEAESFREKAKKELAAVKESIKNEKEDLLQEAEIKVKKLENSAFQNIEEERSKLNSEVASAKKLSSENSIEIEDKARVQAKDLLSETKEKVDDLLMKAEDQAEAMIKNAYKSVSVIKKSGRGTSVVQVSLSDEEEENDFSLDACSTFDKLLDLKKKRQDVISEKELLILEKDKESLRIESEEQSLKIINDAQIEAEKIVREAFLSAKIMTNDAEETIESGKVLIEELNSNIELKKKEYQERTDDFREKSESCDTIILELSERRSGLKAEVKKLESKIEKSSNEFEKQKEFLSEKNKKYDKICTDLREIKKEKNEKLQSLDLTISKKKAQLEGLLADVSDQRSKLDQIIELKLSNDEKLERTKSELSSFNLDLEKLNFQKESVEVEVESMKEKADSYSLEVKGEADQYVSSERDSIEKTRNKIELKKAAIDKKIKETDYFCKEKENRSNEYFDNKRKEGDEYFLSKKQEIEETISKKEAELVEYEKKEENRVHQKLKELKEKESLARERMNEVDAAKEILMVEKRGLEEEIKKQRFKADSDVEKMKEKLQAFIDSSKSQSKNEYDRIIKNANIENEKILEESKVSAQLESEEILGKAKLEGGELLEEAHFQKKEILAQANNAKENAEKKYHKLIEAGEIEANNLLSRGKDQAGALLSSAKVKSDSALKLAETEALKIREAVELERQESMNELKLKKEEIEGGNKKLEEKLSESYLKKMENLEIEFVQRKKGLDEELAKARLIEEHILEDEKRKMLEKQDANIKSNITNVSRNIITLVMDQLDKSEEEFDFEKVIPLKHMKILVSDSYDPDSEDNKEKLRRLVPHNASAAEKERSFYKKAAASAVAAIVVVATFVQNPNLIENSFDKAISLVSLNKSSTEVLIEEKEKERRERPKFNPKRFKLFRKTYTDNILYLDNYRETVTDKRFKKKWTVALNRFLVNELFLSENSFVKVVAAEVKIHTALLESLKTINRDHEKNGIKRLRKIEIDSFPELKSVFVSDYNWKKFWEFKKTFFKKQRRSRGLAGEKK